MIGKLKVYREKEFKNAYKGKIKTCKTIYHKKYKAHQSWKTTPDSRFDQSISFYDERLEDINAKDNMPRQDCDRAKWWARDVFGHKGMSANELF